MSVPTTYNDYYGDETRWFIGTVIRVDDDPERLGRVKVRIYGVHPEDPEDCAPDELPYASVILPSTEAGASGYGGTVGLKPSAQVFGIFLDGKNSQMPLILGSIPKRESTTKKQGRELVDPNGYYVQDQNQVEYANGGGDGDVYYASFISGQTRNRQIQRELFVILQTAAKAAGVEVEIFSGGQDIEGHGTRRTGSTRHDAGYAADVYVYDKQGKQLRTNGRDPVMNKFITELAAAGAKGIGAHPRYMGGTGVHVDLWGEAKGGELWGEGGTGDPPQSIITAFREGQRRFYQAGVVDSTAIKNKNKERSLASEEYANAAGEAVLRRITAEGSTANDVGTKANESFKTISTTTGDKPVKDEPVAVEVTETIPGQTVKKNNTASSDIGNLTGSTSISAPKLDEIIAQGNVAGMNAALVQGLDVQENKVAAIVTPGAPIESEVKKAVEETQAGGVEKVLGEETVVASRKVSDELGNPFGSSNLFGSIGSGISNILSQLVSLSFNQPGFKSLDGTTAFLPEGVQLINASGEKVTPPPVVNNNGHTNVADLVSTKQSKKNLYTAGLEDSKWAGVNSRGTQIGGSYEFKTLSSTDHIEAEMRFASNQREITSLIIDWTNLPFGYDNYTIDEIHQSIGELHTKEYGINVVNAKPNDYGIQTHMYVHQSGKIKRAVPPKNPIKALKYPVRQDIYDHCIHITLNASSTTGRPHRQLESLDEIIKTFIKVFPGAEILGANDLLPELSTTAPGFSVRPYVLRKFGKESVNKEIPVTIIPSAKQLADLQPDNVVTPQSEHNKRPDPNKLITQLGMDVDYKSTSETWFNDNQDTIDLLRQKAEKSYESVKEDGSGISNKQVTTLDEQHNTKLMANLRNKLAAANKGLRYV